jgi:hypothetical protein
MKPFSGDDVIILKQTPLFMRGTNRSGTSVRMSSMVELVVTVVALLAAGFLVHAIETHRAL